MLKLWNKTLNMHRNVVVNGVYRCASNSAENRDKIGMILMEAFGKSVELCYCHAFSS